MRRLNRILRAQKGDLFESRGGEEAVSPQERMLIEAIVRTWFLLESVDAWLLENKALVNKRKRALFPIVLQRGQLADSLARYLTALGLERRKPPAKALADIIASTVRNGGTEA